MHRLRALLLIVLALTHLSLGGLGGRGVLCVEPGCVFRVEQAGTLCCDPGEACFSEEGDGSPVVASVDCCDCVDITLPRDLDRSTVEATRGDGGKLLVATVPPAPAEEAAFARLPAPDGLDRGRDSPFPPARTFTVLRC